jgi:hypothetical protein
MNSRERVLKSLLHNKPDQVPVDFGSTAVTGMHVTAVASLREYYGLEKRPVKIHEPYQMLGLIEEDLKQVLGIDVEGVPARNTIFGFPNEKWKPWRTDGGLDVLVSEHFKIKKDSNGDTLIYPKGDTSASPSGRMPKNGYFFDTIIRQQPIQEDRLNPQDNLEEFGPITDGDLEYFADSTRHAAATGRAVMATFGGTAFGDIALVPAPFLTQPKGIRDVEEWYVSTVNRRDYIHKVFEKQCEYALSNLARVKAVVGDSVDTVFVCGTDFGTQSSTFCSEATFRDLYYPYYKQINDWIHKNTTWKTFKHSCGAVVSLIPAMIECGFDILNPVQCSAAGMEAQGLKERYGDKIVFWGGGIDTQKILPFGTPEQVRDQVLQRCRVFSKKGGFIFNTVHNVQANTPVENIVAMFEAVKEFNGVK